MRLFILSDKSHKSHNNFNLTPLIYWVHCLPAKSVERPLSWDKLVQVISSYHQMKFNELYRASGAKICCLSMGSGGTLAHTRRYIGGYRQKKQHKPTSDIESSGIFSSAGCFVTLTLKTSGRHGVRASYSYLTLVTISNSQTLQRATKTRPTRSITCQKLARNFGNIQMHCSLSGVQHRPYPQIRWQKPTNSLFSNGSPRQPRYFSLGMLIQYRTKSQMPTPPSQEFW